MIDNHPPPTPSHSCAHLSELIALMDKRPGKTRPGQYPVEADMSKEETDMLMALIKGGDEIPKGPKVYALTAKERAVLYLRERREGRERTQRNSPMPGGYFKPVRWTDDERRRLREWRKDDAGINVGPISLGAVPRHKRAD